MTETLRQIPPEEEMITFDGQEYPRWIVDRAKRIAEETESTLAESIRAILVFEEARRNAKHSDPNEPIRAISTFSPKKDTK